MTTACNVRVRFHRPSPALRHYFTTFYLLEIDVPNGGRVSDCIHPEWGGLRMLTGDLPDGGILGGEQHKAIANVGHGPTSTTIPYTIGTSRMWGIGFLPVGWAKFIGVPASDLADQMFEGSRHPAYASFRPLIASIYGDGRDEMAELGRIDAHFMERLPDPSPDEDRIIAVHEALVDPDISTVAEMAEAAGVKSHTLERLCRRHFGFTPRLLLRRQRFMRSLAQYVLDPSHKWIGAIDPHYHDQAQFVRDFHRFIGMSPSEYAALPHPVMNAVMRARQEVAGAAVQALHPPGGTQTAQVQL